MCVPLIEMTRGVRPVSSPTFYMILTWRFSQVVIPLLSEKGEVLGVFDLDCPVLEGYSEEDASFLQSVARMLVEGSDWSLLAEKEVEASEVVH